MRNNMTFTFQVDPALNAGADEAFNQCGEPWWWAVSAGEILGAGYVDLTGATFKSLHNGSDLVLDVAEKRT